MPLSGLLAMGSAMLAIPCQAGYVISTVAGGGQINTISGPFVFTPGIGDGGAAASAYLRSPEMAAAGISGDFYIADTGNNLIRHVTADGTISTVAGAISLIGGFSGDGGPAAKASLNGPTAVAVDSAGNVFIADRLNNRIRKIDTAGTITTVAGSNNVFNTGVGDGGPATSSSLSGPQAIAIDSAGNLYIADTGHFRIRKVDANGVITTVVGKGYSTSSGDGSAATGAGLVPYGIALDGSGNLYIADHNGYIRKVANGIINSVAGTGAIGYTGDGSAATSATLNQPRSVAIDGEGNLLIADTGNHVIRSVNTQGIISTVAGSGTIGNSGDGGPAGAATLDSPAGLATGPGGIIYVADAPFGSSYRDSRIRVLAPAPGGAPAITTNGVVPVFSSSTTISPGSWISIFGSGMATGSTQWNDNYPIALGNAAVTIDGQPAYLWYVSPTQINAQVPDKVSAGSVVVRVTTPGGSSILSVNVGKYSPAFNLFSAKYPAAIVVTPGSPGNSGQGFDYIGPVGAFAFPTRPVSAGETLVLFGVGFGPTNPTVPAGQAWSGVAPLVNVPGISIGDVPAEVTFAGLVGSGLYQFNVIVPDVGSGDMLLQASANGFRAQKSIFVSVR